jgi:multiple sugar transport system substrate-binding protein
MFRLARTLFLVLTVLALASLVVAQEFPAPLTADQAVTIRFYSYNLGNAAFGPGTEKLIAEFMAANPNITVEGVPVPGAEMTARVQADIVAGTPPDVAQLIFDGLDFIATNFNAKPLESIVPPEELTAHFEGFSPNGLQLGRLNELTYGLPFTFSTPVLFYNADVFRAAGLDPDAPPTTWEQAKEYALQIASATEADGIHIAGLGGFDWIVQSLIGSNGGQVLSDDRTTIEFGSEAAIGAISMWQDLRLSGAHSQLTDAEITESMFTGNLGMYLQSSAIQRTLISNAETNGWELRAAAMPAFGEQPTTPVNSGSALFIFSDDVAKQRAAWEFLKFVTSERGYTIITSDIGYLPLRPAIVEDPQYLQEWAQANPLVFPNLEQLTRLRQWVSYPGPNWRQIETILLEAVQQAVTSDGDVATIMTDAAARAQALLMP